MGILASHHWHTVKNWLLEALFPSFCLGCGVSTYRQKQHTTSKERSVWLCTDCAQSITPRWRTICHLCGKEKSITARMRCAHPAPALASLSHLFLYDQDEVRALLHAFKYRYVKSIAKELRRFCAHERLNLLRIPADIIVPLPLHPKRFRMRGFNQATLIARSVSRLTRTPLVTTLLRRRRNTSAQMTLSRPRQRKKNIAGAFAATAPRLVRSKNILLVDDVVTTGATLEEAARILRQAGARKVHGFVIARD